ncbi:MAG: hypothetical protein ACKOGA_12105 [Planctomycetaceae bacterium]
MGSRPEELWQLLEAWGLPFRESQAALSVRCARRADPWRAGVELCEVSTRSPLEPVLTEPWNFSLVPDTAREPPPCEWEAAVRQFDDAHRNLAVVTECLVPVLGTPVDSSVSNTREWTWWFGHGGLVARVFPPELNPGANSRFELDPGLRTECRLRLVPGWAPELTAEESQGLRAARCLWSDSHGRPNRWPGELGSALGQPRQLRDDLIRPAGVRELRLDEQTGVLWWIGLPDLAWVIPRRDITSLDHLELWPAKGPGGGWLSILGRSVAPGGQSPTLTIAEVPAAEVQAQLAAARVLADTLQVPLRTAADYDC